MLADFAGAEALAVVPHEVRPVAANDHQDAPPAGAAVGLDNEVVVPLQQSR